MEYAVIIGITLAAIIFVVYKLTNKPADVTSELIGRQKEALDAQTKKADDAVKSYNQSRDDFKRRYSKPDGGGPGRT